MATNAGSGSALFKVFIGLLVILLIFIIKIPNSIWEDEKAEQERSHFDMTSIYESEKLYHRLTNKYTTDGQELLKVIKQDSSLHQTEQLVKYTQDLRKSINNFISNELVATYLSIDQTIQAIISDLVTNERYFKINKEILTTADELRVKLSIFHSDVNYPNYSALVASLDSLYQLQRDMTDYSLQTAASKSASLTEHINSFISNNEIEQLSDEWTIVSKQLKEFRVAVKDDPDISKNTSVSDRLKDFIKKVDDKINQVKEFNSLDNINSAIADTDRLNNLYQTFLADFLITSKFGMYRLSPEDSMVLYISEENLSCPVSGEGYVLMVAPDSSDVKVESPLLVKEIKEKLMPLAEQISSLDFIPHYLEYKDSLDSILEKGKFIKSVIRRDLNITIKNKEIEEVNNKYYKGSEHTAADNLVKFVEAVRSSNSFSDLKQNIENARNAVGIFKQVYDGQVFANIDSLSRDIKDHLTEYNQILDEKRRLPKEVQKFNLEAIGLDQISEKIKQMSPSTNVDNLSVLQSNLEETLLYASQGESIRVYGIFKKSLQNFGYIYKNSKSWEEEE